MTYGDLGGGSAQLDQQLFLRPFFPWFGYSTPIHGVYLCSASTHPGAGVHGACGFIHEQHCRLVYIQHPSCRAQHPGQSNFRH